MRRAGIILLPVFLLIFATPALAKKRRVPTDDYPTIQSAVDAANDGDRIFVRKGTYTEDVVMQGKTDIRIVGKHRPTLAGAGVAFTLIDCTDVKIKNFDIEDSTSHAIVFQDVVDGIVKRVRIRRSAGDGVRIEGGRTFRVRQSIIEDQTGSGIYLGESGTGPSRRAEVKKCKIRRNKAYGVYISGESYHHVRKSKIKECGWGIHFGPDSLESRAARNRIEDCVSGAIGIEGMQNICRYNKIKGGPGDGIVVSGTDCWVRANKVRKIGGFGLRVAGTLHQIQDNRTSKVGGDGRIIEGSEHEIYREKGKKAGGRGFHVLATDSRIRRCRAGNSGSDGFFVAAGATGNLIRSNETSGSAGEGLVDENAEGANEYKKNSFR